MAPPIKKGKNLRGLMPTPLRKKFWKFVEQRGEDECWPWIGPWQKVPMQKGSHRMKLEPLNFIRWKGLSYKVQRVAYQAAGNRLRSKEGLLNLCGDKHCCNPNHIYSDPFTADGVWSHKAYQGRLEALERLAKFPDIDTEDKIRDVALWDWWFADAIRKDMYKVNGFKIFNFRYPKAGGQRYIARAHRRWLAKQEAKRNADSCTT